MLRRILTLSKLLSYLAAAHLLALTPVQAQSTGLKQEVKHYGYSGTDKLLQCIQQVYGKPVAAFPYIRRLPDVPCPVSRAGIEDLLESESFSKLLRIPKGEPRGVRLFDISNWVYIVPSMFLLAQPANSYRITEGAWNLTKIETKVEAGDDNISEGEAQSLAPEVLKFARMIHLGPIPDQTTKDGEVDLEVRLRFYKTKLGLDAPESVITIIDQPSLLEEGRLVYGEMRDGKYIMLWDSPLLNSRGGFDFEDVNGDGSKEIVWRSATCSAQNCAPRQLVVFDKNGREITRQEDCNTESVGFDETDGVCAIEGSDIQFTVISPYPGPRDPHKPKDIVARDLYTQGKVHIFALENGIYARSKLSASDLYNARNAIAVKAAVALNEQGMTLMKEGKYGDAAKSFSEASQIVNSENPLYDNNAGYAYYKSGNYKYSVGSLGMAIRMDPKRAIAYLNRGDAFAALYRTTKGSQNDKDYFKGYCAESSNWCVAEARKDYEKYLELAPDSKAAPDVKKKLAALPPSR